MIVDTSHADDVVRISEVSPAVQARDYKGGKCVLTAGVTTKGNGDCFISHERHATLSSGGGQAGQGYPCVMESTYQKVTGSLMANSHPGSYTGQDANNDMLIACNKPSTIVRRLTPLECERLQGFPDGWTDIGEWTDSKGKIHKEADSPRYKALGNSIAIPPWTYVLQKLSDYCGEERTMASLFDGIGGFPLIWSGINGAENCVWASEIEEFPIAVTKIHFPEVANAE